MAENSEIVRKLTKKQYKFYMNLVSLGSKDPADIIKCYIDAGYAEDQFAKYRAKNLYYSKKFQQILTAHREKQIEKIENRALSVLEKVTQNLNLCAEKAEAAKDWNLLRQVTMDLAKLHGLLAERHIIGTTEDQVLSDSVKQEALALAEMRLLPDQPADTSDIIDAEFSTDNALLAESDAKDDQNSCDDLNDRMLDFLSDDQGA